jgi:hypothetical protein
MTFEIALLTPWPDWPLARQTPQGRLRLACAPGDARAMPHKYRRMRETS